MLALLRFALPAIALLLGGLALTTVADGARWGALLLHAEPLAWLGAVAGAYLAWVRRQRALALGLLVGVGSGSLALRAPLPPRPELGPVPGWMSRVRRCAGALEAPGDDATVLVWTVPPGQSPHELVADVVRLSPDVAVLLRLRDPAVVDAVVSLLGGESAWVEGEGGGVGVYTKGELPLCGEDHLWSGPEAAATRYAFTFVKLPSGDTFPLLAGWLPAPTDAVDWDLAYREVTAGLGSLAADLGAVAPLVVADASATSTYRHLDGALAGAGLRAVGVPPNWPARLGPVPGLPLQPFDRAWVGPGWRARAYRLDARVGLHAPVWLQLSPGRRTAAYQRPTSPTPLGDRTTLASTSPTTSPAPRVSPPPANSPPAR